MKVIALALVAAAAGAGYGLTVPSITESELLSTCQEQIELRRLAALQSEVSAVETEIDL